MRSPPASIPPASLLVLALATLALLTACGGFAYHRVREGETLYSIGWRYGLDHRELARWNGLEPPYLIRPGQLLRLEPPPGGERRRQEASARPRAGFEPAGKPRPPARAASPLAVPQSAPGSAPQAESSPRRAVLRWRWPAEGPVLRRFREGPVPGRGIQIGGRVGQPVRAAADGVVVYAGRGLPQYGALVIIKHDEHYLSAYGHNRALLVREGQRVKAGQRIASMGEQGGRALLHFEIRYDGRPRDPLRLLPRR